MRLAPNTTMADFLADVSESPTKTSLMEPSNFSSSNLGGADSQVHEPPGASTLELDRTAGNENSNILASASNKEASNQEEQIKNEGALPKNAKEQAMASKKLDADSKGRKPNLDGSFSSMSDLSDAGYSEVNAMPEKKDVAGSKNKKGTRGYVSNKLRQMSMRSLSDASASAFLEELSGQWEERRKQLDRRSMLGVVIDAKGPEPKKKQPKRRGRRPKPKQTSKSVGSDDGTDSEDDTKDSKKNPQSDDSSTSEESSHSDMSSKSDDSSASEETKSSDDEESSQPESNASSKQKEAVKVAEGLRNKRLQRRRLSNIVETADDDSNNGSESEKSSKSSNSGEESGAKSSNDKGSESSDFETESTDKKYENSEHNKDSNPGATNSSRSKSTNGDTPESENDGESNGAATADDNPPATSGSTDVSKSDSGDGGTGDKVTVDDKSPTTETAASGHERSNESKSNADEATGQSSPPQSGGEASNDSTPVVKNMREEDSNDETDLTSRSTPLAGNASKNLSVLTEISDVPTDEKRLDEDEDDSIESTPGAPIPRAIRVSQIGSIPASVMVDEEMGESSVVEEKKGEEGESQNENSSIKNAPAHITPWMLPLCFMDSSPSIKSEQNAPTSNRSGSGSNSDSSRDPDSWLPPKSDLPDPRVTKPRSSWTDGSWVPEQSRPRSARYDFTGTVLETTAEGAPEADDMSRDKAIHSSSDSTSKDVETSAAEESESEDTSEGHTISVVDIELAVPEQAPQQTPEEAPKTEKPGVTWAADVAPPQPIGKSRVNRRSKVNSAICSLMICCFCVILLPLIAFLLVRFVFNQGNHDCNCDDSFEVNPLSPSASPPSNPPVLTRPDLFSPTDFPGPSPGTLAPQPQPQPQPQPTPVSSPFPFPPPAPPPTEPPQTLPPFTFPQLTFPPTGNPTEISTTPEPTSSPSGAPFIFPSLASLIPTPQTTSAPTLSPFTFPPSPSTDVLMELLSSVSSDGGEALRDTSTPQHAAMQWVRTPVNSDIRSDKRFIIRYALATLYFSTGGKDWTNSDRWLTDANECDWYTINSALCDAAGEVTDLALIENNLVGTLPKELGLLSDSLVKLRLSKNSLTGEIPTEFGSLSALTQVQLSSNRLVGSIPFTFALLTELNQLYLSENSLQSTIPTGLGVLTNIRFMDLGSNQLNGKIPTEFGQLVELEGLALYKNLISGTIPSELANLTKLSVLYLDSTSLDPSLPEAFCERKWEQFWADCDEVGGCSCCTACCSDRDGCSL